MSDPKSLQERVEEAQALLANAPAGPYEVMREKDALTLCADRAGHTASSYVRALLADVLRHDLRAIVGDETLSVGRRERAGVLLAELGGA